MIQELINRIIEKQVQEQLMEVEKQSVYRYGYILLFEISLNVALAIVIGCVTHNLWEILFFLCNYIPLRSFCGGWHADRILGCTIVSNIILIIEILCVKYISDCVNIRIALLIFFLELLLVLFFAPVETDAKRISRTEMNDFRKKIKYILLIHMTIVAILIPLKLYNYIFIVVYAYGVQIIMLLLEKMKQLLHKK